MYFINNGGLQDDDLGLVTDPLKLKIRMNADDSGESSPSTSMATLSVAPSSAGADMVRSGATYSDGAEGVRCGATCSDGAIVLLAWTKTSWADGLPVEAA